MSQINSGGLIRLHGMTGTPDMTGPTGLTHRRNAKPSPVGNQPDAVTQSTTTAEPSSQQDDVAPPEYKVPNSPGVPETPHKKGPDHCQAFIAFLWYILAVIVSFFKTLTNGLWSSLKGISTGVSFLVTKCFSLVSYVIPTVWSKLFLPHYIAAGTILFFYVREISMFWAFLVILGIVAVLFFKYINDRSELEFPIEKNIETLKEDTGKIIKIVQEVLRNEEKKGVLNKRFGSVRKFFCDFFNWWSKTFGTLLENMKGNEINLVPWNNAFNKLEEEYKCICNHDSYVTAKNAIIDKVKKIIADKKVLPSKLREFDEEWNQYIRELTFGLY